MNTCFYSIVKSQTIEVLTIVVNMERPVGLLSEEPLRIGISVANQDAEYIEDGVKCKGFSIKWK